MSSIGKLVKQAARMQQQMEQIQAQLALRTVEAASGGGAVKVVAKCDGTISAIKIDPQAINPADAQLLEDMLITAINSALEGGFVRRNGQGDPRFQPARLDVISCGCPNPSRR
jgi:DNA-binding YbaB/EbfC family protein